MPSLNPRDIDDPGLIASLLSLLEHRVAISAISYFPPDGPADSGQLVLRLALQRQQLIQPEEYQGLCAILTRYFRADQLSAQHIAIRDDYKLLLLDERQRVLGRLPDGSIIEPSSESVQSNDPGPIEGSYYGYSLGQSSEDTWSTYTQGYYDPYDAQGYVDQQGQAYDAQGYYDPQNPETQGYYDENGNYVQGWGAQTFDSPYVRGEYLPPLAPESRPQEKLLTFHFQPETAPDAPDRLYLEIEPTELSPFTGRLSFQVAPQLSLFPWDFSEARIISLQSLSLSYLLSAFAITSRALTFQAPVDLLLSIGPAEKAAILLQRALFKSDIPVPSEDASQIRVWMQSHLEAQGLLSVLQPGSPDQSLNLAQPIGYPLPLPANIGRLYLGYRQATREYIFSCFPNRSSGSEPEPLSICNLFVPQRFFITSLLHCCHDFLEQLSKAEPKWLQHPACQALKEQITALAELAQ